MSWDATPYFVIIGSKLAVLTTMDEAAARRVVDALVRRAGACGYARADARYVNIEEPWQRTPIGFDSRDHLLDIVVTVDLSTWHWKDEVHERGAGRGTRRGLASSHRTQYRYRQVKLAEGSKERRSRAS